MLTVKSLFATGTRHDSPEEHPKQCCGSPSAPAFQHTAVTQTTGSHLCKHLHLLWYEHPTLRASEQKTGSSES